ncbi:MAG: FUSC family protein [Xanthobacteraceae bacterium]|nr:FUSC family protein [Xanthobacteraceae bacterium]
MGLMLRIEGGQHGLCHGSASRGEGLPVRAAWSRISGWLSARRAQFTLGLRVMMAALAALTVALALRLPLPLWAVLTAVIVTQMSVGRSIKVTTDYLIGTIGGAIYGGVIAVLFPHTGELALLAVMALAVAPLAVVAAINPSLNVAPVTAIIVLLLPSMTHGSPLESAIDRVIEVAVGAFVGLAVSFAVLPSRAHNLAITAAARMLDQIAATLDELLKGLAHGLDSETLHRLQDGIGAALVGLNGVALEAERERVARVAVGPDTGPLLRTLLRLRHDLVMIGRAAMVRLPDDLQSRLVAAQTEVRLAAGDYLRGCEAALLSRAAPPPLDAFEAALRGYIEAVSALRRAGRTRDLPVDVIERFFMVGFALEQLHQNFIDLRRCVDAWSHTAERRRPA